MRGRAVRVDFWWRYAGGEEGYPLLFAITKGIWDKHWSVQGRPYKLRDEDVYTEWQGLEEQVYVELRKIA